MTLIRIALIVNTLIFGTFAIAQTAPIYQCVDNTGARVMQDTPCIGGKQTIIGERPLNDGERETLRAAQVAKEQAEREQKQKQRNSEIEQQLRIRAADDNQQRQQRQRRCGANLDMQPTIGVSLELFRECRDPLWAPTRTRQITDNRGNVTEYWHMLGGAVLVFTNGRLSSTMRIKMRTNADECEIRCALWRTPYATEPAKSGSK